MQLHARGADFLAPRSPLRSPASRLLQVRNGEDPTLETPNATRSPTMHGTLLDQSVQVFGFSLFANPARTLSRG